MERRLRQYNIVELIPENYRRLTEFPAATEIVLMAQEVDETRPNPEPSAYATNAVLRPSDPVPDEAREVTGIEFNDYRGQDISARELVAGMANMGFQATAVSNAVQIINDMVGHYVAS